MRGTWSTIILMTISLGFGNSAWAQIDVKARLDSAAMLIGDPNRIVVSLEGSVGTATVDWSVLDTIEQLVILGEATEQQVAQTRQYALPFSVYDSVGLLLPNLPVYLPGETLYTNDLALLVEFPPQDSLLHPYRGIRTEGARLSDYLHWFILLGLVLLGAAVLYYLYRRRQNDDMPSAPVTAPDPAHVIAFAQLEALRQNPPAEDKSYYSDLDRIFRTYLENRYRIPALERTSGEIIQLLSDVELPQGFDLTELLNQVDLVKFAKAKLPDDRRNTAWMNVHAFVAATKQLPVEPQIPDEHAG